MYWQVYLHKTVIAAETLLVKALQRASYLANIGVDLFASPDFKFFLYEKPGAEQLLKNPEVLMRYSKLDDSDIFLSIKVWSEHSDKVLSDLCAQIRDSHLPKIELKNEEPFDQARINELRQKVADKKGISLADSEYYVFTDSVSNKAYSPEGFNIKVLFKDGTTADITAGTPIAMYSKPLNPHLPLVHSSSGSGMIPISMSESCSISRSLLQAVVVIPNSSIVNSSSQITLNETLLYFDLIFCSTGIML
jgi:HD superfamily phosphohydrolase